MSTMHVEAELHTQFAIECMEHHLCRSMRPQAMGMLQCPHMWLLRGGHVFGVPPTAEEGVVKPEPGKRAHCCLE